MTEDPRQDPRLRGKFDLSGKGPDGSGTGTSAGAYAGMGIQFALSILLFLYLGQWLDRRLGTDPWLLLLFVFGGAGASFYSIYSRLMKAQEREEAARKRAKSGEDPRA